MGAEVRVALVEDDTAFRAGVEMLLEGTAGFACAGAWGSVEMALAARAGADPDIVLLDIGLPGTSGDEGVEKILAQWPESVVLMFTASADDDKIFGSLFRGASGYLLKGTAPAKLLDAISEAHDGGSPMSPAIARKVVQLLQQKEIVPDLDASLTEREKEILSLLARGRTYQTAADDLDISINTVRNYIRSIYEKLQVHSQTEAVSKALRAGLI